jgi:hypothetical protein
MEEVNPMEEATPVEEVVPTYETDLSEAQPKKMSPGLTVVLVVLVACVVLVLVPVCIIALLALLGPVIGEVFSSIVVGM